MSQGSDKLAVIGLISKAWNRSATTPRFQLMAILFCLHFLGCLKTTYIVFTCWERLDGLWAVDAYRRCWNHINAAACEADLLLRRLFLYSAADSRCLIIATRGGGATHDVTTTGTCTPAVTVMSSSRAQEKHLASSRISNVTPDTLFEAPCTLWTVANASPVDPGERVLKSKKGGCEICFLNMLKRFNDTAAKP